MQLLGNNLFYYTFYFLILILDSIHFQRLDFVKELFLGVFFYTFWILVFGVKVEKWGNCQAPSIFLIASLFLFQMQILTPNNNIFLGNSSKSDQNLTKAMQQERQNVQYNIQNQFMTGNHHLLKKGKGLSGRWSKSQHDRFIKGLQKFGRNWVEVQKVVKTRSLTQVRSHAQKVFLNSGNNGLNLSMQSQNSDQISYQDSSEVSQVFDNDVKYKSEVNKQAKINLSKNSITQKQYLTVSCIQKQKQNQLTKQEQEKPSISSILPDKKLLQHYLNTHQQPSHFMQTVVLNFQYLRKGGNFIELCLGEGQSQDGGEGV